MCNALNISQAMEMAQLNDVGIIYPNNILKLVMVVALHSKCGKPHIANEKW